MVIDQLTGGRIKFIEPGVLMLSEDLFSVILYILPRLSI